MDKDKRTYKSIKEYRDDISYENEVDHSTTDDRGTLDLTRQIDDLKRKVHNAELETSLVKAVGMNSPEMKKMEETVDNLKKENYQLKKDMAMEKETHQIDLLVKDQEIGRLMKKVKG